MPYAIMRVGKIKSNAGGIGKHNDRSYDGEAHFPANVNESKTQYNIHWDANGNAYSQKDWTKYTGGNSLTNRINARIKKGYNGERKIRKDATKALEYLFASDTHKMNEMATDQITFQEWIIENKKFLEDIHGKQNIISMHCHFDEATPHLHAVVVPLTKDGRLCAKDFVGSPKLLQSMQTEYAKKMAKFDMSRGQENSKARHIHPKDLNQSMIHERA